MKSTELLSCLMHTSYTCITAWFQIHKLASMKPSCTVMLDGWHLLLCWIVCSTLLLYLHIPVSCSFAQCIDFESHYFSMRTNDPSIKLSLVTSHNVKSSWHTTCLYTVTESFDLWRMDTHTYHAQLAVLLKWKM